MSDYDHTTVRRARVDAQDAELQRLQAERARKLTESMADNDTTPGKQYANSRKLRNRSADAMKDQGI